MQPQGMWCLLSILAFVITIGSDDTQPLGTQSVPKIVTSRLQNEPQHGEQFMPDDPSQVHV